MSQSTCETQKSEEVSILKRIKCFPSKLRRRSLKTQQSPIILNLCLRKTRTGKPCDYRDVIVCFQNVFCQNENKEPVFLNSSSLKSVFDRLRFRDGLVWTVDLTVELKLRFEIPAF